MNAKIFIAVPIFNRVRIVEQCLPTLVESKDCDDLLALYDDGSTDGFCTTDFIFCPHRYLRSPTSIGIEAQRRQHLRDFWQDKRFTHFYATDSDALHDPNWRQVALDTQEACGGAMTCLYNTDAHVRIEGNTINDSPHNEVIWRRVAPGISYLLTREHVAAIMPHIDSLAHHDWQIPGILGNRCAITRTSYVDHIGLGGLHHPATAGLDEGDRCLNPTPWLQQKRREVVEALSK